MSLLQLNKKKLSSIGGHNTMVTFATPGPDDELWLFLPSACKELYTSFIFDFTFDLQEDYVNKEERRRTRVKEKSSQNLLSQESIHRTLSKMSSRTVPLLIVNDTNQRSVELVFKRTEVPRQALQIIAFTLPYHPYLTRLTFRWVRFRASALYEIAMFLPNSFITDLCFDDCPLPEANFYTLLESTSSLRNLSLDRCCLGDPGCAKLVALLVHPHPAALKLATLSLASNHIGDSGARALGNMLRSNRTLLHLNLSGNYVTDDGADYILSSLIEFQLTFEEIAQAKKRRLIYMEKRCQVYNKYYAQLLETYSQQAASVTQYESKTSKKKPVSRARVSPSVVMKGSASSRTGRTVVSGIDSIAAKAEILTDENMGTWLEPFSDEETVKPHGTSRIYSLGNRVLCSLNLSYNSIGYFTAVKLVQVLRYQESWREANIHDVDALTFTGLIRVVAEGCPMPSDCREMDEIREMLDRFVSIKIARLHHRHSSRSPKAKKH